MDQRNQHSAASTIHTLRDRIGISIWAPDPPSLVRLIEQAEAAGVAQVWMGQVPVSQDTLTTYAVALGRTERIRLGTSIVPTYPRHPLALAQQVASVESFGAGRLRLGIGPSHRPLVEDVYGIHMEAPLEHLREYVSVLRAALWGGTVEHEGRFFTAKVTLPGTARVPILVSALGKSAFRLAGEISDGAISWNCPPPYLRGVATPALRDGAQSAGRASPPLVAQVWVALSTDVAVVRASARERLGGYARLPFYAKMFAEAGYPVGSDGSMSDELIDCLLPVGDQETVATRLKELLGAGIDALLVGIIYG
jgi:F420-dependent oxidoreductase-like protein